jgi:hypothetical protein
VKELVKNTPPTEEEDEALREEFGEYRDSKSRGTRRTNADAAKDVTWTGDRMYDEVSGSRGSRGNRENRLT